METAPEVFDTIIIGAGPAGLTAGIYSARKGLQTLVIAKSSGGNAALAGTVENFLGFTPLPGSELAIKFKESFTRYIGLGAWYEEGVEVKTISGQFPEFKVETVDGKTYRGKTVIIASGRAPKMLGIPGEKEFLGRGVSTCSICDAPLYKDKNVAIVGGGNSALGAAMALTKLAKKIMIVSLTEELAGDQIVLDKIKKSPNVEILTNSGSVEILGEKVVTGLKIKDIKDDKERVLAVDGVFVEIGYTPTTIFDTLTDKNTKGEIVVDESGATSVKGIWAAGDVNNLWGEQMIISAGEGAKVALSVANYLIKHS